MTNDILDRINKLVSTDMNASILLDECAIEIRNLRMALSRDSVPSIKPNPYLLAALNGSVILLVTKCDIMVEKLVVYALCVAQLVQKHIKGEKP